MKLLAKFTVIFFSILLIGCANTWTDLWSNSWTVEADNLVKNGKCAEAMSIVDRHNINFADKLGIKGEIYRGCFHDFDKAVAYLTLAARYGHQPSIESLLRGGLPVPTADLKNQSMSAGEAILRGFNSAPSTPTNNPSTTVTNCQKNGSNINCISY